MAGNPGCNAPTRIRTSANWFNECAFVDPALGSFGDVGRNTIESPGYKLAADIAFRDIRPEEYAGLVLSGGRAPEYLRYDQDLMGVTRYFFEKELPVASVCHGIEIVATAGVLRGRTVTTVRKCRFDAEVCGATFVDQEVVVSGNLVTARTWHDNPAWMREYLKLLRQAH